MDDELNQFQADQHGKETQKAKIDHKTPQGIESDSQYESHSGSGTESEEESKS